MARWYAKFARFEYFACTSIFVCWSHTLMRSPDGGLNMTQFVDVKNMSRWIRRDGVEPIMAGMVKYLE